MGRKIIDHSAEILFTVAIIFVMVMIFSKGNSSISNSTTKYDDFVGQFGNVELVMFDNGTASGSDVLKLIVGLDSDTEYTVSVTNGENSDAVVYSASGVETLSLSEAVKQAKDKSNKNYYINPNATFTSSIDKDANGVVTQVIFVQEK